MIFAAEILLTLKISLILSSAKPTSTKFVPCFTRHSKDLPTYSSLNSCLCLIFDSFCFDLLSANVIQAHQRLRTPFWITSLYICISFISFFHNEVFIGYILVSWCRFALSLLKWWRFWKYKAEETKVEIRQLS